MICDKSNDTETGHCVAEFDLISLTIELFYLVHLKHLLVVLFAWSFVSLTFWHLFPRLIQLNEPSVTVINELDESFLTRLARCAMIQKYFENVHHCGFVIELQSGEDFRIDLQPCSF